MASACLNTCNITEDTSDCSELKNGVLPYITSCAGTKPLRVAIIGAGASGLAAIKCCLEEGIEPICFEKEDDIGGLWNYSEICDKPSVYKSCTINTSKEMIAFSDFPVPSDFPPFMPHTYVMKYFRMFAKHFDLLCHITFNTIVEDITPTATHSVDGTWEVTTRRPDDSQSLELTSSYDGVMVCSGHHVYPYLPPLEGMNKYQGKVIHSSQYRTPDPFIDKRVLIVGAGNSAADIAVDISRVARQVYISTNRGAWVVSRMGPFGFPADALANSRFVFSMPLSWLQWLVEKMANFRFSHYDYGLQAGHRALEVHPTINDELPHRIQIGAVQIRPGLAEMTTDSVVFHDGSCENVDSVVMATGYTYSYKFFRDDIMKIEDNHVPLYKYMFPPDRRHHTMAVIGLVQPIGSVIPIAELQARWFTRVITGRANLPSRETMLEDISTKKLQMVNQYVPSRRHTLQTFWIEYMDELAHLVGVQPRLWRLLFKDPLMALRCFFGPCTPAQYRLNGPGSWKGAHAAICRTFNNNRIATRTRTPTIENATVNCVDCHPDRSDQFKNMIQSLMYMFMLMSVLIYWYYLY